MKPSEYLKNNLWLGQESIYIKSKWDLFVAVNTCHKIGTKEWQVIISKLKEIFKSRYITSLVLYGMGPMRTKDNVISLLESIGE